MAKCIKLYVNTGFAAVKHEDFEPLPPGWDAMPAEAQEQYLNDVAVAYRNECIGDFGAYVVDDEDDE